MSSALVSSLGNTHGVAAIQSRCARARATADSATWQGYVASYGDSTFIAQPSDT